MTDELEDPRRAQEGVPKMAKIDPWGVILRPFWELWDPLVGPPGFLILVYHFVLLPPYKINVMIMTICCQSGLDGSKIEKIQDFGQF